MAFQQEQPQPSQPHQHVVELRLSSGERYHEDFYIIRPFSAASWHVQPKEAADSFYILPSRVVDLITMRYCYGNDNAASEATAE